jgi:hypothetical protein
MQFFLKQENREAPNQLKEVLSISQSSAGLLANAFEGVSAQIARESSTYQKVCREDKVPHIFQ